MMCGRHCSDCRSSQESLRPEDGPEEVRQVKGRSVTFSIHIFFLGFEAGMLLNLETFRKFAKKSVESGFLFCDVGTVKLLRLRFVVNFYL